MTKFILSTLLLTSMAASAANVSLVDQYANSLVKLRFAFAEKIYKASKISYELQNFKKPEQDLLILVQSSSREVRECLQKAGSCDQLLNTMSAITYFASTRIKDNNEKLADLKKLSGKDSSSASALITVLNQIDLDLLQLSNQLSAVNDLSPATSDLLFKNRRIVGQAAMQLKMKTQHPDSSTRQLIENDAITEALASISISGLMDAYAKTTDSESKLPKDFSYQDRRTRTSLFNKIQLLEQLKANLI